MNDDPSTSTFTCPACRALDATDGAADGLTLRQSGCGEGLTDLHPGEFGVGNVGHERVHNVVGVDDGCLQQVRPHAAIRVGGRKLVHWFEDGRRANLDSR